MLVLKGSTPEELRDSIVEYLEFEKVREHSLVDQKYDTLQKDRHARQQRISLLAVLIGQFKGMKITKGDE